MSACWPCQDGLKDGFGGAHYFPLLSRVAQAEWALSSLGHVPEKEYSHLVCLLRLSEQTLGCVWRPRQRACPRGSKARALDADLVTCLCSMCPSCTPTALRPHWLQPRSRLTNMHVWRGECKVLQEALALSAGKGWVQLGSLNKYRV